MKRIAILVLLVISATTTWAIYTGDYDPNNPGSNGLANETDAIVDGVPYGAATYQNFVIPFGSTYVDALFTNNMMDITPQTAYWEIRTDMFINHGGNIIASGTGYDNVSPTGRGGFGYAEYQNWVNIPNMELGEGTYWFAVVPQAPDQNGRSFNSTTFGLNGYGYFIENEVFWNSAFFGAQFRKPQLPVRRYPRFSGAVDDWIPEPLEPGPARYGANGRCGSGAATDDSSVTVPGLTTKRSRARRLDQPITITL